MSYDPSDTIVPIVLFAVPAAAIVITRYFKYRERMEMIRHGMVPPVSGRRGRDTFAEVRSGAAASRDADCIDRYGPDRALRKGLTTAFIGLALLIGLSFIGGDSDGPMHSYTIHPGPWLLGGLIPLFVGLAQIVGAVLSGAQIPRFGGGTVTPPYPGASSAPPPYPGARPTSPPDDRPPYVRFEELTRPTPPPERRP